MNLFRPTRVLAATALVTAACCGQALANHSANAIYKGALDNPGAAPDGTVELKVNAAGTAIEYFKATGIQTGCGTTANASGAANVPIVAHGFNSGTLPLPYFGNFYARMRVSGDIQHIVQGCQTELTFNASTTTPPAACMDGVDNDGDQFIDGVDPGCSSQLDNDEGNPSLFDDAGDDANAPPVLSGLAVKRNGRRIVYRLSESAEVVFTVARRVRGRWRRIRGALRDFGEQGANSVRLGRRIGSTRLRRGRYRLTAVPEDGRGATGATVRVRFRIRR